MREYVIIYLAIGIYMYLSFCFTKRKQFVDEDIYFIRPYLKRLFLVVLWPILPWVL